MNEKLNYVWKTVPISLHKRVHPYEYQNLDFQTYKGNVSKQTVNYKYIFSLNPNEDLLHLFQSFEIIRYWT